MIYKRYPIGNLFCKFYLMTFASEFFLKTRLLLQVQPLSFKNTCKLCCPGCDIRPLHFLKKHVTKQSVKVSVKTLNAYISRDCPQLCKNDL